MRLRRARLAVWWGVVAIALIAVAGSRVASGAPDARPVAPARASDHPPPPVNTAPPVVTGAAQEGNALQTSTGAWSGDPTSFAYAWLRCDANGASCAVITGAAADTYLLTNADVGATIRSEVTATNQAGSASAQSAQTPVVAARPEPCKCDSVRLRLAGFNAHGTTTLKGIASGKEEAAEFWDFVVKKELRCTPGQIPDCVGFAKTVSKEKFPPFATQKPKGTFRCTAKECKNQTFTFEVRIRITREQILEARQRWKEKKRPLTKRLRIRSGCTGTKGAVTTFTLVFTNGNYFDASKSDQDGDGKPDGKKK